MFGLEVQSTHRRNLHELILGKHGVELNSAIQEQVDNVSTHNTNLRTAAEKIIEAVPFTMRVEDVPAFCDIPFRSGVAEELREMQLSLGAARRYGEMAAARRFTTVAIPEIHEAAIHELFATTLESLSADAAEHVHLHAETLGSRGEQWLSEGIQFISPGDKQAPCPFCAQPLSGSELIEHYREYFGQEYGNLKQRISSIATELRRLHGSEAQIAFERAVSSNQEQLHFWKQFLTIDDSELKIEAESVTVAWSTVRDQLLTHVTRKQAAPLEEVALSKDALDSLSGYALHRDRVTKVSAAIEATNEAIQERIEQAAGADPDRIAIEIDTLRRAQVRYSDELTPLCNAYLQEAKDKAATEEKRDAAKKPLRTIARACFPPTKLA